MYQKGATHVRNFDQNFSLINCNVEHSIKNKHFFYLHNTRDLLQNFAEIDFVRFVNSLRLKWKTDSIEHVRMITVFACILRKDQYFPAHETNMSKSVKIRNFFRLTRFSFNCEDCRVSKPFHF